MLWPPIPKRHADRCRPVPQVRIAEGRCGMKVYKKKLRSPAARERYAMYQTPRWKRLRKQVLKAHPVCCHCGQAPSTQADHIRHRADNATFWDWDNLQGSCAPCNNREGARDRHRRDQQTRAGGRNQRLSEGHGTALGSTKQEIFGSKPAAHRHDAASIAAKLIGGSDQ